MNTRFWALIVLSTLSACAPPSEGVDVSGRGGTAVSREIPSFAAAQYSLNGDPAPLFGSLTLNIGPDSDEVYYFNAMTRDASVQMSGQVDLKGSLRPVRVAGAINTARTLSEAELFNTSLGVITVARTVDGQARITQYAISGVDVAVEKSGLFVATFSGVDVANLDGTSLSEKPGGTVSLTGQGRIYVGCNSRQDPANVNSPVVLDLSGTNPRCTELSAGF